MKKKIKNLGVPFILRTEDDGTGVLAINGSVLMINEITVEIINRLEEGENLENIATTIALNYHVGYDEVISDIKEFLTELDKYITIKDQKLRDIMYA
ncbi:PqqD family protein [Paenibacillus senegalimassiliensis]|uniref:PqqD family protein n=1 Tax=Paenibacillus senegalimassiliensis TaxID=1737426 RepID=UPI00073F423F|nr:PqqD family protein [Paenibacillus senegalimassiliensis]